MAAWIAVCPSNCHQRLRKKKSHDLILSPKTRFSRVHPDLHKAEEKKRCQSAFLVLISSWLLRCLTSSGAWQMPRFQPLCVIPQWCNLTRWLTQFSLVLVSQLLQTWQFYSDTSRRHAGMRMRKSSKSRSFVIWQIFEFDLIGFFSLTIDECVFGCDLQREVYDPMCSSPTDSKSLLWWQCFYHQH